MLLRLTLKSSLSFLCLNFISKNVLVIYEIIYSDKDLFKLIPLRKTMVTGQK